MDQTQSLFFGPYRLDRQSRTLWRGTQQIPMRSRVFSLLQYLAERPGEIVSVPELRQHAWQGVHVSKSVFRVCIHELRQALQTTPTPPITSRRHGVRATASASR